MKEHFYRILAAVMAMVIITTGLPLCLAEEQAIELSPEQIAELTAAPEEPTEKASAPEEPAEEPSAEAGEEATVTPEEPTPEPVPTTEATTEAATEPTIEATPEATPEPTPELTPEPDAEATAAPEAEPTPEASAEVTAEPTIAAPAANPPELILPPEWQLDGEVLIIPYTAEDESIRLEWRFDGAVQEYRIQTAPVPETGDEEEKLTDVCTCVKAELLLPIADYTEDVYTLYITAVLEDGASITGMQRFVLMQQASAEVESIPKTPQELADCFGLTLEELAEALGMTMEELMAVDAFTIEEIYNTFSHEINTFSSEVSKSYTGIFETTGNIITTPMNKLIHSHGGVNDGFIPRRSISISKWAHLAGDYTSAIGDDNIFSIADGKVVKSAENNARGCYVVIEHTINNETVYSWYQHMARGSVSVKKDDLVKMGDKIGTKGATGNVEGAHLHFALLTSMEEKYPMSSDFANLYGINEIVEDDYITWQGIKWYNPDKVFLSDGSIIGDGSSNKTLSYENATYKVIKASNIKSEPYSDTENLGRIEVGETVTVTEVVRNRYSNIWVKLRTKNGVEGYVFGGYRQQEDGSLIKDGDMYLEFAGNAKNPVSLSGESLPTGSLSYGKYFSIKGTVSSQNTLKSLTGAIYSDGKCVEKETISFSSAGAGVTRDIDLYSSKINNNLKFGSLENNRSYSFELTAEYYCNRMQATQTQLVAKTAFTIGTPAKPVEPAKPVKPKSVTIGEGSKLRLALDQTLQLTAKLAPDGAESSLTWKTSNEKIAKVSSSGLVTPKKTGSVTITVSTENGKTAKTTITIFNPKTPTGVALDKSGTVSLALGSTLQLNATLKPDTAESKLSWKTSNKNVAKVSSSGLVTPKKTGTAKITVTTTNKKSASVTVKVFNPKTPTGVALDKSGTVTLVLGSTLQLSATLKPDTAESKLSWKTSNKNVAKVSSSGIVTPKKTGTAKITVTTSNKKSASVTVKVVKPAPTPTPTVKPTPTPTVKPTPTPTPTVKPTATPSSQYSPVKDFTYTIKNGKCTITGYKGSAATVSIPREIEGCPVTAIGENAFLECDSLKKLIIPDSVTNIGDYAFEYCESLQSITIPDSVTSIGYGAFADCYSLESISLPNGITNIGVCTFGGCYSLQSITIPNSVTSIGDEAFLCCSSLQSISIPNSVTSIGERTFEACGSLKSITIPNGVTSIGESTFYMCDSLKSITIPNSVTSIGDWAFGFCESLQSITIPSRVTFIGEEAFAYCDNLTIRGKTGSYAERYARANSIPFTAI